MRELRHDEKAKLHTIAAIKKRNKLRCAIYSRKSREDETGTSLSTQVDDCKKMVDANQHLLKLVDNYIFEEDNVSGYSSEGRQEFQKMLELVKRGKIDVLITMKNDRLYRNAQKMEELLTEFEKNQAYIIIGDDFGDNSASGILIKQILYATSEFHVRRVAEDTMKVLAKLANDGKTVGMSNYGYKNAGRKFIQEPEEAIAVSLVFDRFLEGKSYSEIADELESNGIRPRKSKRFSNSSIHGILTNKRNCGISVWNREENQHKGSKILKQHYDEVISNDVVLEPIISESTFSIVQDLLQNRVKTQISKKGKVYPLSGKIKCSICGGSMTGAKRIGGRNKIHYSNYECRNHSKRMGNACSTKPIRADYIETQLKEQVAIVVNEMIRTKGIDVNFLRSMEDDVKTKSNRLKRELNIHNNVLDKLTMTYSLTNNPNIKQATENKIDEITDVIEVTSNKLLVLNDEVELMEQSYKKLNEGNITVEELFPSNLITRYIFQIFIKEVRVDNTNIEVEYF